MRCHRLYYLLIAFAGFVSSIDAFAQSGRPPAESYKPFREAFPDDGVELGRGWFQHKARAAPSRCILGEEKSWMISDINYSFDEVLSREKAMKALNISASARYGAFSANANFAQSTETDRSNVTVLAVVNARHKGSYLAPAMTQSVRIDKSALDILEKAAKKSEADQIAALTQFVKLCGDSYVSAIEYGATYAARFTKAQSQEVRSKLFAASAGGGFGKFKASLSMNTSTRTVLSDANTQMKTTQRGGDLELPISSDQAYDRISQFATRVNEKNAVPQTALMRPYESLPDFPEAFVGIRTPGQRIAQLAALADRYRDLSNEYRQAYFARQNYQFPFQSLDPAVCAEKDGIKPEHCLLQELYESSLQSGLVAYCLESIIDWCRGDLVCNLKKVPLAVRTQSCSDSDTLRTAVEKEAISAGRIAKSDSKDDGGAAVIAKRLVSSLAWLFKKEEENGVLMTLDLDEVADKYLASLAKLPLAATPDGKGGDIAQVVEVCKLYSSGACDTNNLPTSASKPNIDQALREWTFSDRLGKVVSEACTIDLGHPLCLAGDTALKVANALRPEYGSPRRFPTSAPAPVIVEPPPPPPKKEKILGCGSGSGAGKSGGRCDM